ncbi:putative virus X resistance protein-like, coiled-coil [Helianthus annuus]|nr:putative virus X resistance protein-like, coiled-coil [Helianthus annuus]
MAETVASALLGVIFEKLTDEAFKKYVRSQKIHSELNELKTTLSNIKALLNDASNKEITHESVGLWLNSLQHLAYDIDDVLDDVATEAMHRELTQESGASTSKVRKLIPTCCTNFSLSHRLSSKIDSITIKLQQLEKHKSDLGLIVKDEKPKSTSRGNETSLPDGSSVVGRESEIEKLRNKLFGDDGSSKENFSVLPIVGMGGVGKTTLARVLYNDPQVKGHFNLKAWVCVSDDFDIFKISKIIFQAVSGERKEFEDLNQLQMDLIKQLQDKRFLLVLDDVWHENDDDWEKLVRPFHSCAHGSRIIMTTRKEELLIKLGFNHLDSLKTLSHEDALSLFALHALGVQNFDSHTTLKPLGEAIVKKCAGLPLALKAIGTLLKARTNEEDWEDVFNSEIWNLENSDKIVPALRLSYHDLSSNLKQLFAYCSLFPKGFLFDEENLVLMWMAEGFFNQSNAAKSPERLGHEYFEVLLSRSFFQHAPNDESLFMMHDLMNDLSTFVAGEVFLRFENHMTTDTEALEKHRHMSFTREEYVGHQKFEAFKRARSLRTLLAVSVGVDESSKSFYLSNKILVDLLPKLTLLRVLSLSCFEISELPEFIGNLKHLRYLNLSQTKITELPENVGNLYHLQTLIVFGCESLIKLPKSFIKLKKLRHLDIRDTPLLKKMPLGIGELKSLYTLNKIIIGGEDGFAITDLKGFKNLHGMVSIEGLQRVQSVMQAREVNLSLKEITKLELKWIDGSDGSRSGPIEKEVLNMLKPSRDRLKELAIVSYGGTELSNWVGDPSFHKLVNVSIHGCSKCTSLPPFGQLPSLKELFIEGMDEVKVIGSELIGTPTVVSFPSLEILKFQNMSEWKVWSTNNLDVVFPCLQELHIKECPNLIDISLKALPSVRVFIHGCGVNALRSLVQAASLVNELGIASIVGLTNEAWRGVIMYLKAVEELYIWHCDEIRYLWDSEETSKVLLNLKVLDVRRCKNRESLGEKEEDNVESTLLLSLRHLEIFYCESIKHCYCPNSIEYFSIQGCSSLTLVSFPREIGGGQKLKKLTIYDCKKLTEGINNTNMPMLEFLFIGEWTDLKSITQFSNFNHLTLLCLSNCTSIESFQLSSLTSLTILVIINCPSFCLSFDGGFWPPNLVSLTIGGVKEQISEWGPPNFPSSLVDLTLSRDLHVSDFRHLSHLLPSSLTSLKIEFFLKLESLSTGLEHLSSLQHLDIENCFDMKHLPVTLLPSLLSLRIALCPYLSLRCNGKGSHYWPRISHIPCIQINHRYFFVKYIFDLF